MSPRVPTQRVKYRVPAVISSGSTEFLNEGDFVKVINWRWLPFGHPFSHIEEDSLINVPTQETHVLIYCYYGMAMVERDAIDYDEDSWPG